MKHLLPVLFGGCLAIWIGCKQDQPTPITPKPFNTEFPDGWLGTYAGKMAMVVPGKIDSIPVQLDLLTTDTAGRWVYRMTYNAPAPMGKMVKDYRIIHTPDMQPHQYDMDEGGGLILKEMYLGQTFYSAYSMSMNDPKRDAMFAVSLRRYDADAMMFEIMIVGTHPVDTVDGNIYNHVVGQVQKAILKRVPDTATKETTSH